MLPYLLGEKTPVNDPLATGALVGLRARSRRAATSSAPCSRASPTACATTSRCWPSTASRPSRARVTNGGSSSTLWKQIVADVTGLELEPVVDHPGSAFGAAFAAGMGTGAFAEWSDDRALRRARRAGAAASRARGVYDERYRAYRALYPALRAV